VIPETVTVAKAAEALHRTPRYVRRLIADGRLKAVRLTQRGHWLVYESSLSALLGVSDRSGRSEPAQQLDDLILARRGWQ